MRPRIQFDNPPPCRWLATVMALTLIGLVTRRVGSVNNQQVVVKTTNVARPA